MGALGLRLHDFFDMSWYEYQVMSKGYNKRQEEEWMQTKFISYHALIAPNINPKALPRSFKAFLNKFETKKVKRASDDIKHQLLEEYKEYQRNKK